MKRVMKWFVVILSGAVFIILTISAGLWIYNNNLLPDIDGTITSSQIKESTHITRDKWGVPHISAKSKEDANFAFGYTMAQDRLFQMELQRRLARGELSEIMGEKFIDIDKFFRTLLFKHWGEKYLSNEKAINPDALTIFDSFIQGINYFINTANLPVEYRMLGIKPRPFTKLDCIAMLGFVSYSFSEGIQRDSLYTILEETLTSADLETIFPDYTLENRTTVIEPDWIKNGAAEKTTAKNSTKESSDKNYKILLDSILITLKDAGKINPYFEGSNSWVLAPSRSKSGSAIIANDPHIGISNPGVWYEAHIKYPGYENYGYHLPLNPFPMIAHNAVKGWAITMFENDDMDLYAETFNPDKPELVMYKNKWVKIKLLEENIKVKGKEDVSFQIRITPHGPVVSDYIKDYKGKPVAINRVTLNADNPIIDVMYEMAIADNMKQFESALSRLAAPGLNVSYADKKGNIAWWAAGRVPIRPDHVSGKKIHDGSTGKDEWLGYVDFKDNPKLINPANGIIVSTNQLSTLKPVGPVSKLTGYFRPSDRGNRIYELLSAQDKWSIDELKKIQTDTKLWAGVEMKDSIIKKLSSGDHVFTTLEQKALSALTYWNGFMDTDSIGGTVFQFTTYHILKSSLDKHIGENNLIAYLNLMDHWDYLKRILNGKAAPIKGKTDLEAANEEDLILAGFRNAVQEMSTRLGKNQSNWQWGKVHTIEYVHPVGTKKPFNLIFNIGPFPSPAEFTSVNKMKSNTGKHDYKVTSIPSTRRLIDIGSTENSLSILPTGNSGNFLSNFYNDQTAMFLEGGYRSIVFNDRQLEQYKAHEMSINPDK